MARKYIYALTVLALLSYEGVKCLKDVNVKIPLAVTPGDTVTLYCQYDLENDPLYTVKWYKGRQEFFRYIPKELPHTKVFPLPGVNVDLSKSGAHEVVLRDVQLGIAGKYRCEVSADAPSFHTTMVSGYMHVVYLPEGEPKLIMEKQRYSIGETLRGNCTSPPAFPPANLTWIVNGKEVNQSFLVRTTVDNDIPEPTVVQAAPLSSGITVDQQPIPLPAPAVVKRRQTTIVGLELELTADNFHGGRMHVQCVATVLQLYKARTEITVEEEKPRLASVLSTRDTDSASGITECSSWTLSISLLLSTVVWVR